MSRCEFSLVITQANFLCGFELELPIKQEQ